MAIGEEHSPSKRLRGERAREHTDHDIDTDELDACENNETTLTAIDLESLRDAIGTHNILPLGHFSVNRSGHIRDEEPTADELSRRFLRFQIRSDISTFPGSLGSQNNSRRRGSPNWDLLGCLKETNLDGDTLLNIYIINQDQCAYWLINLVPSPECLNWTNNLFQSPLHLAVLTNQPRLVRRLMVGGAIVDFRDNKGDTPLHIACRKGYVKIAEALLQPIMHAETIENDYDVPYQKIPQNLEILNSDGLTCLHVASMERNIDVILLLLSKGSNINAKEAKSGKTILHMAVESGDLLFLHFLLQKPDIDIGSKMYNGTSAIDLARGLHFIPMTWLLRDFGSQMSYECETSYDYESLSDLSDEESEETDLEDTCETFNEEMDNSSASGWTGVRTESSNIESMEMNTINMCENNQDGNRCSDFQFEQTRLDRHDNESAEMDVLDSDEHVQEATDINTQIPSSKFEEVFRIEQDNNLDQNRFECVENRDISPNSSENGNCSNVRNEIGKGESDIHLGHSVLAESPWQSSLSEKECLCTSKNRLSGSGRDVLYVNTKVRSENELCENIKLSINISKDSLFSNIGACNYDRVRNEQHAEMAYSGNVNGELDSGDFNSIHCVYRSLERRSGG